MSVIPWVGILKIPFVSVKTPTPVSIQYILAPIRGSSLLLVTFPEIIWDIENKGESNIINII